MHVLTSNGMGGKTDCPLRLELGTFACREVPSAAWIGHDEAPPLVLHLLDADCTVLLF
jgi:hypothetical protein